MKLKELTQIAITVRTGIDNFCISKSYGKNEFVISTNKTAHTIQLNYNNIDDNQIKLEQSLLNVPKNQPTKELFPAKIIFNNANDQEKPECCLEPILLPEIQPIAPEIYFISSKLSPNTLNSGENFNKLRSESSYCAQLTNYGYCEIRFKPSNHREWTVLIADISKIWLKYCETNNKSIPIISSSSQLSEPSTSTNDKSPNEPDEKQVIKFKIFHEFIRKFQITAIDWNNELINDNKEYGLACCTAFGNLVIFSIPLLFSDSCNNATIQSDTYSPIVGPEITIRFVSDLLMEKINCIKWYTFSRGGEINTVTKTGDSGDSTKISFLCCANTLGIVKLYSVEINEQGCVWDINKQAELWNISDSIKIGNIQMEYDSETGNLIVLICKGAHCLTWIINIDDFATEEIITPNEPMNINRLNPYITGFSKMSPLKYVICSLSGLVESLTINPKNRSVTTEQIQFHNINFKKYILHGLEISNQNAFWILALYPRKAFDHLVLRAPFVVSICSQPITQILENLKSNYRTTINELTDNFEVLRFAELKSENINDDYFQSHESISPDNPKFLYELKIKVIYLFARFGYLRRKYRINDMAHIQAEILFIKNTILAIKYYQRINFICEQKNPNELTQFQILSAKCIRSFLLCYGHDDNNDNLDRYLIVRNTLKPIFESICKQCEYFDETAPELCLYCNDFIESKSMKCKDGHEVSRCCITAVQVPIVGYRHCHQCNQNALDNIDQLKEATYTNLNTYLCPICDVPLDF